MPVVLGAFDIQEIWLNGDNSTSQTFDEAYYNRGLSYYDKGEFAQAITDYDKAIELNPKDAETYNNRGNAYTDKGGVTKAVSDFEKCIELSDDPRLVAWAQQMLDELR